MIAAEPTGFEAFWQMYVLTYGAPILQLSLWVVQIFVFIYAIMLLKRYVDFVTGRAAADSDAADAVAEKAAAAKPKSEAVKVEEFVE